MDRTAAIELLDELHRAQNAFYAGGDDARLRELLAPGITWCVPGSSPIAGRYSGIEAVFAYFRHRRERASGTFRMHRRDVLTGDGDRIAALTDGRATIGGRVREWSTVGIYDVLDGARPGRARPGGPRITACWLLPFDPAEFDAIWSA